MRCFTHPAPFHIRSVFPSLLIVGLLYGHGGASSGTKPIQVVLPPLISRNAPPTWIQHPDSLILDAGESRLLQLRAVDPDLHPISFSHFAAPNFVVLVDSGNGSGVLVVSPPANVRGRFGMLLIATDSLGAADSVDFRVVVLRLNSAPVWQELEIDTIRVREGRTIAIQVAVDDPEGDSLTVSSYGTVHSALAKSAEGRYDLVVAPSLSQAGIGSITIIAADYELADTMHIPLIVEQAPGNHPPVWSHPEPDSITLLEGAYTTLTLTVSDFDGDPLTVSDKSEMETVLTHLGDGVYELVIAPAVGDTGLQYARVIAFDGRDADTLEIAVLVRFNQNRNHPPVINNAPDGISLNINRDTVFVVGATDADGDLVTFTTLYAPTFVSLLERPSSPPHARLADVYVSPKTAHHGLFQMYLIASDGSLSDSASLLINVSNVNYWPEIADLGHHTIAESDTMLIVIQASDANGSITTLSAINLPANATFVDHRNNTGTFRFLPNYNQAGSYKVGIIASDGSLRDTAYLSITVADVPRAPQFAPISPQAVDEGRTIRVRVVSTDPDGDPIMLSANDLPSNAVFTDSANGRGDITFAPVIGQIGTFGISLVASDGVVADTLTVLIMVLQTSFPPDSVAEVDFVTDKIADHASLNAIDQVHVEDIDLDGVDEILFRESIAGVPTLRIWVPAGDSFWTIPTVGVGIKSFSLRSGGSHIGPVVWTTENELLALSHDGLEWEFQTTVPDSITRVQCLPPNPQGAIALGYAPVSASSTSTDPFGCAYYWSTQYSRSMLILPVGQGARWPMFGYAQPSQFDFGSMMPVFYAGEQTDLLAVSYRYDYSSEACGIPHEGVDIELTLSTFRAGDSIPIQIVSSIDYSCQSDWCPNRPNPYERLVGLGKWNDSSDHRLKLCFAGFPSVGSPPLPGSMYRLTVLSRGDTWTATERGFNLPIAPSRGGVVTVDGYEEEYMLVAPESGFGHIISIPDAVVMGRLLMPASGRFKTGYVLEESNRDLVFKTATGISIHRITEYIAPRDYGIVHEVPADFATIQSAMNAAISGDTVLVSPGSYSGTVDFLGKDVCLKSLAGAQSTIIVPASTKLPTIKITAGESEMAILEGFTIRYGSQSMLQIANEASPTVRNNIFRDFHGSSIVIDVRSPGALITRNLIVNNTNGVGIAVASGGPCTILNNTLDKNGIGVTSEDAATVLQNNIITRSKASGVAGRFATVDYNNTWSNTPNYGKHSGIQAPSGLHDINVDPLFINDVAGDYHLQGHSLCIDNGAPDSSNLDPDGTIADIGAFPVQNPLLPRAADITIRPGDPWHLIVDDPVVQWTYAGESGTPQLAYEAEIGTDNVWPGAEHWSSGVIFTDLSSFHYAGPAFDDGHDYFLRLRVKSVAGWGTWSHDGFHTNSLPAISTAEFPVSGTFVSPEVLVLFGRVHPDPDGDTILSEIEIHDRPDFSSKIAGYKRTVFGTTMIRTDSLFGLGDHLQYWWRIRSSDAFEIGQWSPGWVFSTTTLPLFVPSQQPTIQDALQAIGFGDTVFVEPGDYATNLTMGSKGVVLLSTDGPKHTTIRPLDSTRSTIVISASTTPTTVEGFTIARSGVFAIYAVRSTPRILHNSFFSNVGAIKAELCKWLSISENTFVTNGNLAQTHAATTFERCDSIEISRNLFHSGLSNGEIHFLRSSGAVVNNTLVAKRNYGMYVDRGRVNVLNNIVVEARSYAIGEAIAGSVIAEYNCTSGNITDYQSITPGAGSVFANPLFVNSANGDYRLSANSPCIDAGHPDPLYNDPDGSRNDIGAFPFVPGVSALAPDDLNGDGVVDVRDAVVLIDQTVRSASTATADPERTDMIRTLIARIWGYPLRIQK